MGIKNNNTQRILFFVMVTVIAIIAWDLWVSILAVIAVSFGDDPEWWLNLIIINKIKQ